MDSKSLFANTINDSSIMNDCETFGSTWGCRADCPVLQDGECENYSSVYEFLLEEKSSLGEEYYEI